MFCCLWLQQFYSFVSPFGEYRHRASAEKCTHICWAQLKFFVRNFVCILLVLFCFVLNLVTHISTKRAKVVGKFTEHLATTSPGHNFSSLMFFKIARFRVSLLSYIVTAWMIFTNALQVTKAYSDWSGVDLFLYIFSLCSLKRPQIGSCALQFWNWLESN